MFDKFMAIPMPEGKTRKDLARLKNNRTFVITFSRLVQDALKRYEVEGLPETVSLRVLLQSLLWYGCAVFFEYMDGLFCLPGAPTGNFNIYGDPSAAFVFSRGSSIGFDKQVELYIPGSDENSFLKKTNYVDMPGKIRQGVIVWDNYIRFPFIQVVLEYAQAISDSLRTLDVCRKNIKTPYIVIAEESIVPTVERYFKERDDNNEFIISSGIFDAKKINMLPIAANSDNLRACTSLIEWYESKFRELCGIDSNSQIDKKGENIIRAEVDINDDYTDLCVEKCIDSIQEGLDNVNKIFGTDIKVKKREKSHETEDIQGNPDGDRRIPGGSGDNSDRRED